ncbi:Predicted transcriptional regulator YdeE, contains AraC-type DNA-binding domain [Lishizhenia tianjinensis]|uniref:Predicted transcriptional regulator YdeE, contains AraC-type DNA-binding domain n=1 Tax=Lishizhenia tianjinensis TaxID=477690 RepID=A0A1I6Y0X9_9FLAO|nr:SRPBCC family protein [Lishizhenia tianjinensis]SFT43992.1 Predicted transcriptional regulator YdeE, contains AraC-type DNA-binding domain [Lishizhenia tianjinensis]
MPRINVDKSIFIDVKPSEVYEKLMDFNHWKVWSPWTITEKEVVVTVDENNQHYHWKGNLVGEGEMRITGSTPNSSIEVDLNFIKPFKSKAKVAFIIKAEQEGSRVHWTLDNKLPFFMFFFKNMMTAMIGMDYNRGLLMLKEYLEEGKVKSNLEFVGNSSLEAMYYIGRKTTTSMDTISDAMTQDYKALYDITKSNDLDVRDHAFSIYHEWKLAKNQTTYTAAIGLYSLPDKVPNGFVVGNIPAQDTYVVKHTGPYHHIGNAWSAIFMRDRAKIFKKDKNFDPIELYLNSPENTAPEDLVTEIHMGRIR